jgi:hypothetical protein
MGGFESVLRSKSMRASAPAADEWASRNIESAVRSNSIRPSAPTIDMRSTVESYPWAIVLTAGAVMIENPKGRKRLISRVAHSQRISKMCKYRAVWIEFQ